MSDEYFNRERLYQTTIALARAMLNQGLITENEFTIIDTKMRDKYNPLLGTLFSYKCPN